MNDEQTPDLRASARELHDAGLCVLPVKRDGSKAPDVRSWTQYQAKASTPEEHDQWFGDGRTGIGILTGAVSGNIELIEFEGRAIAEGLLDEITEIANNSNLGDLWQTVTTGWADESPSGGVHFKVKVDGRPVAGSKKLASRLAREDEYTDQERERIKKRPNAQIVRVLIETRGEGGFVVLAPSHGRTHPSGKPYVRLSGGPSTMAVVTPEELDALHVLCEAVDAVPKKETKKTAPPDARQPIGGQLRPGEDYENKTSWADILEPDGWTFLFTSGHTSYWGRPGKDRGVSATTGYKEDRDRLYVFSTSTEFEDRTPYTKFGAYAHLHHGGDHTAAARDLARQGYGSTPPRRRLNSVPTQSGSFTDGSSALDPDSVPSEHETSDAGPDLRVVAPARPELDITNEADAIDGLLGVMAAGQLPDLYKRSGGPCWVHRDDNDNPLMQQLSTDNLRAYLADHVTTYQVVADPITQGTKEVRELLMPKTCSTVLGRKDWPLPPLRGIVTSPVIRADGTLLQAPGYDGATGLYLAPRVALRRLRAEVTADSLEKAKEIVLEQMLADFPWAEPSDRAHFLGALLTTILRPYFYGPTPMFIITATAPGSGKSLLKDIFKYAYGIAETAWPENDTELRKSITTQLYTTGQPVVVLDNLPNGYIIKSPVLSSLLTTEHWGDRVLGSTTSVTMPNDRLWILTGNGLRTGGDNGRRAIWVRLDPNCPDPDQRDGFRVGDLRPWLRANASTVVAALVTLVRAWIAEGAPTIRTRKGDYSEWASMLAGLLNFLGVPGWMADRGPGQDDEEQEWAAFLAAWHRKLGDEAVAAGAIIAAVPEQVPRQRNGEPPSSQGLGGWLKSRDGRYFSAPGLDNYKPVKVWDAHKCQNLWRVEVHQSASAARGEA